MEIKPIAYAENDFTDKFAIPRQSGLCDIKTVIRFVPPYGDSSALKGLEGFSHLWLIWGFSENIRAEHALTVRPPRLGGNERIGVFASRSPFRPNNLGLSCVQLVSVQQGSITVSGADIMNGTPIFDVKPYVPYADAHPNARGGFTDSRDFPTLTVMISDEIKSKTDFRDWETLTQILHQDPRPAYHTDENREYGFYFGQYEVKFKVKDTVLTVTDVRHE